MKVQDCILCFSGNKIIHAVQDFEDEYLTLIDPELNKIKRAWIKCGNCDLIYHDPQLEESETKTLYQNFRDDSFRAESPDAYFDRITSLPISKSENHAKVQWLKTNMMSHIKKSGSILDIGSGGGVFLHSFLKENSNWTPYCVEPTASFAKLSQRKLNCAVFEGNYEREIFDTKFELISCNQVLEHAVDPKKFLSDIYFDLNNNGYLYLEVPDSIDFEELPETHDRFLAQHLWYFSRNVIEKMLIDTGFEIIKLESQKTIRVRNNLIALVQKKI